MTQKRPTVGQLLRKIERLEAEIEMHRKFRLADHSNNYEYSVRAVDAEMRIKQAIEILNGEQT